MQKQRIFINAIMSLVQIVVVSGVLFVLYRFLLKTIGVEQLGIWSLVLATTSVTQVANFGLSGSVVKFVAKYVARGEDRNVSGVIQTAVISLGLIVGFVLLVGYPLIKWVLGLVMPLNSLELALRILPFALFSLWLMTITSVFQSGLDGFQRIYIRNLLMMGGSVVYALLCFMLAPKYGLIGLAYAQIINNSLILIVSWILIKRFLIVLPVIPYQWNRNLFKEIISYGINIQAISITQMFYDPLTKVLLGKFGGLSMVGYYEMASRMIMQVRALIVSANQVLVPAIAEMKERDPNEIQKVYQDSYELLSYLSIPLFVALVAVTPVISQVWVGHYELPFVVFSTLLAFGWLINTLSSAAYFMNLGIGDLRWNTIAHLVIGVLNLALGLVLGYVYTGLGVVLGWVTALIIGSFIIPLSYHRIHRIPIASLFPKESLGIGLSSVIILCLSFSYSYWGGKFPMVGSDTILVFAFLVVVGVPVWLHPMRKRLIRWITDAIS